MAKSCLGFFIVCLVFPFVSGFNTNFPTSTFSESFFKLYGDNQIILDAEGKSVQMSLTQYTGSGFISQHPYSPAYFSASIKLPTNYTAGVVVTYYTSNQDHYPTSHDELDFEFLGNVRSTDWVLQTNLYGNGSNTRGREERYRFWFDPTNDFHSYSILWTEKWIVFYVDNIPIREVQRVDAMGGDFPSKPMYLYGTIWDGSDWATDGGRLKVDYRYAPFVAQYSNFVLHGCPVDPNQQQPTQCNNATDLETFNGLTTEDKNKMDDFRKTYMTYSYCFDRSRYPTPLPECVIGPQ